MENKRSELIEPVNMDDCPAPKSPSIIPVNLDAGITRHSILGCKESALNRASLQQQTNELSYNGLRNRKRPYTNLKYSTVLQTEMERKLGQVSGSAFSIPKFHNIQRDMINSSATPERPAQHCSFPYQPSTSYWTSLEKRGSLPLRPRLVHPSQFFSKVELLNGQEGKGPLHYCSAKAEPINLSLCREELNYSFSPRTEIEQQILEPEPFCNDFEFIDVNAPQHLNQKSFIEDWDSSVVEEKKEKKIFNCEVCNKSFTRKDKVERHWKTVHSSCKKSVREKLFHCKSGDCNQVFTSSDSLKEHVQSSHLYHQCSQCNRRFSLPNYLVDHIKTHHPKVDKSKICRKCGSIFIQEGDLRKHYLTDHIPKIRFSCNLCEQKYRVLGQMRRHMKIQHPVENENDFIEIETKKKGSELSQFINVSPLNGSNGFKCAQSLSSPITVNQTVIPESVILGEKSSNRVSSLSSFKV